MENAKQEKKVGVGEVVLNSLADHMKKSHSKNLKKNFSNPTGSFTQSDVSNHSATLFLNASMTDFNILFIALSNKV